jgi:hypothetical protein
METLSILHTKINDKLSPCDYLCRFHACIGTERFQVRSAIAKTKYVLTYGRKKPLTTAIKKNNVLAVELHCYSILFMYIATAPYEQVCIEE